MKLKFYIGDPKKGGKEVSSWDYMKASGLLDGLKKEGMNIFPNHDFELLKPARQELFEKAKKQFKGERALDHLETSDFEINCLYQMWLRAELKVIDGWLKEKGSTNSTQIELLKYQKFVTDEIEKTEKEINPNNPIFSDKREAVIKIDNSGGSINLKAGDGGANGDGGDLIIKAGDGGHNQPTEESKKKISTAEWITIVLAAIGIIVTYLVAA